MASKNTVPPQDLAEASTTPPKCASSEANVSETTNNSGSNPDGIGTVKEHRGFLHRVRRPFPGQDPL